MQLIRDAWASIPAHHRIWVVAIIAAVIVAAMWLGLLMPVLEWWRGG